MEDQKQEENVTNNQPLSGAVIRKLDTDDQMRLRSSSVIVDLNAGVVDNGMLQKTFICCGIKEFRPFFSDSITERKGVTDAIFNKRWSEEFRTIPVDVVDQLYKMVLEANQFKVRPEEIQKK